RLTFIVCSAPPPSLFPYPRSSDLMPPGKELPDWQIAVLRNWIQTGAPMPEGPAPKQDVSASLAALEERPINAEERQFWIQLRSTDRKSTRLNSSQGSKSYAVLCFH